MLKTIFRISGGAVLFIVLTVAALFLLHPRIPLGPLTGTVSSLLTFFTGSEQEISGRYFLVPGAWTTLSIENGSLLLTGSQNFRLKTEITSAQTTVHLWSLFKKEINLDGVAVHGVNLDFSAGNQKKKDDAHQEKDESENGEITLFTLQQTGDIILSDISVNVTTNEQPVSLQIEEGQGGFGTDIPLQFNVNGVLNNSTFSLDIHGGSPAELATFNTDWPISAGIQYRSVTAQVNGFVSRKTKGPEFTADLSLSGEYFEDIVSILGIHGPYNKPFALQGRTVMTKEEISADFSRVQMGNEIIALSVSVKKYLSTVPYYTLRIHDDLLDLDTLKAFFHPEDGIKEQSLTKTEKPQITRDDIILPAEIPVKNFVLDLDLKELVMGGKKAEGLVLKLDMIDGVVDESPFAVTLKNSDIKGHLSFRTDNNIPHFAIHYNATSSDIGAILKNIGVVDDFVMKVDETTADLKTSGRTIGQLVNNLAFAIKADNGRYEYHDPNTGAVLPVTLEKTEFNGAPGEKITAAIEGKIGNSDTSILLEIDDRRDEPPETIKYTTVQLDVQIVGVRWQLAGTIPLPFSPEGITLHSTLTGENLSGLNELLNLHLPALGPYKVAGDLSIVPQGYRLENISVQVGASVLNGDFVVNTKAVPPDVQIELESERIQLTDFKPIITAQTKDNENVKNVKKELEKGEGNKRSRLTDQSVLNSYNATILLTVKDVLSGTDHLGSGQLKVVQQDGNFEINPLEINMAEGLVTFNYSTSPSGQDRLYTLNMRLEHLDYGLVARWFNPDTDMSGIINMRTSLKSVSPDLQGILPNGSGYLDFCVQPIKLRSGIIDLWAVNIFSSIIPLLAPKDESVVHCAAGRLNMEDGILKEDELIIDTSQIRVNGTVEVDFNKGKIDAVLRPVPKRPQFYSLSTPIEIKGKLSDINAGVTTGGVIGTIVRLATSYIVVPMQWIIQNKLPEDGTADCLQLVEERSE